LPARAKSLDAPEFDFERRDPHVLRGGVGPLDQPHGPAGMAA